MEDNKVRLDIFVSESEGHGKQEFTIKEYKDHIEICDYRSVDNMYAEIPSKINGKPVTVIGDNCFFGKKIETVSIPDTVTSIGMCAFGMCNGLREIIIPDSVTEIGRCAFHDCKHLKKVVMPSLLKRLSTGMFAFCYFCSDTEIILNEGLEIIEAHAFYSGLASSLRLRIPDSVKEIAVGAFEPGMDITTSLPYDKGWFMDWPYGEKVLISATSQIGKITDIRYIQRGCCLTEVTVENKTDEYFYPLDYENGTVIFDKKENQLRLQDESKSIKDAEKIRNAWRRGLI